MPCHEPIGVAKPGPPAGRPFPFQRKERLYAGLN